MRNRTLNPYSHLDLTDPYLPGTKYTVSDAQQLADALYAVRCLCPGRAVLGIHWMHPIRALVPVHAEILSAERLSSEAGDDGHTPEEGSFFGLNPAWLRSVSRCIRSGLRTSYKLGRLQWHLRDEIAALKRQRFDLVAKTWWNGAGQPDFYYGDLQARLAKRGVRMLLLCGDALRGDWQVFGKAQISVSGLCRLPELCLVPPVAPIQMAAEQVLSSLRLGRIAARATDPMVRRVSSLASRDCLDPWVPVNGLFYWIGRNATRTWHPRAFVTLYEGYGWEKCAWWGAKVADASCITVGYQHTVVFPYSISLLRPTSDPREHSAPDVVLCTGEQTKRMMLPGHLLRRSQVITFGTFRRDSGDRSFEGPRPTKRTVLVLPEGSPGEEKLHFDWSMKVARLLPNHHFIFRCHPILPFSRIRPYLEDAPEGSANIEISDRESIKDDFDRSSVVIYRGVSAVFYAVLHGLKPIYLHSDCHHDVDPLFELKCWREVASSSSEIEKILRDYEMTSEDRASVEWRIAADYVNAYTRAVDDESVDRFLKAVGLV